MDFLRASERLMAMDDTTWLRHANPWSVWMRMLTTLPFFALAVWSRVWIGGWAWIVVAAAVLWVWANPRIFPAPASTDNWASRGVMGERIFLTDRAKVAAHHRRAAGVLGALCVPGLLIMGWGLYVLWWEGVVFGMILGALPKIWFVDRMVWVYEDWARANPGMEHADV